MALSEENRNWYYNHIERIDPERTIARINRDTNMIHYNRESGIRSDENYDKDATPEELVRALTLAMLISNIFRYEAEFMYFERYFTIGHPGSRGEVDLIIYDQEELPFSAWEMKSSEEYSNNQNYYIENQLFNIAPNIGALKYLVYSTIHPNTEEPELTLKIINYNEYNTFETWLSEGQQLTTEFPPDYEDAAYRPLQKGTDHDLKINTTHSEFRTIGRIFHQTFFGEKQDTDLFKEILKLLLAKIYDEKTTIDDDVYRFQILYSGRKEENLAETFERIRVLYRTAYKNYIEPNILDEDIPDLTQNEFSPDKVKFVVRSMQKYSVTKNTANQGDIVGSFFEEILRFGFKQDKGMYFTHTNLVNFMIEAVDLENLTKTIFQTANHISKRMPYVIDPACGAGTFLLTAMNTMSKAIKDNVQTLARDDDSREFVEHQMSDNKPNLWAKDFIYGMDPKFVMALTSKINMVLHGDGSAHIYKYDGLDSLSNYHDERLNEKPINQTTIQNLDYNKPVCEHFDVILTNPPFGITLDLRIKAVITDNFNLPDTYNSESLFFERWFQLLKPKGRIAAVLPESFFNTGENIEARLMLYKFFNIKAIVSLPQNLFVDTPTLTSLLFAQKKTKEEIENWNTEWNRVEHEVVEYMTSIKAKLRQRNVENINELKDEIIETLGHFIDTSGYVIKKGKAPIKIKPDTDFESLTELKEHFKEIFRLSGFNQLLLLHTFKKITEIQELNYNFKTYAINEVGYKLSKRNEKSRPNQLCSFYSLEKNERILNLHLTNDHFKTVINTTEPTTVLDFIKRDIVWE